ncbi:putative permease [Halobacteroides halobius DSM 5150]|uniref:Putative permease n=1 Tax=Halobacteroides halobius (strain ATCC 35273 / DSM 5150 / MD-1) TaxID=748449 RepID=L0KDD2_HALHC|nr:AEC family transporter [Halobacteroides halobius]AGB42374.1 putative permease [Halobacteroides halobius DSM 5150]
MDSIIRVLPNIIPILCLIILGYILNKLKFTSADTINEFKNFVLNVSLPALLFQSFLEINLEIKYIFIILTVFLANLLMLGIGKFFKKVLKIENPYFALLFTGFAAGVMGIPLFSVAYGAKNVDFFGMVQLGQEFYVWFILFPILSNLKGFVNSLKDRVLSFLESPIIISILLGLVLNLLGYNEFNNNFLIGILNTIDLVGQVTLPLILITIGYKIKFKFEGFYLPLKTLGLRLTIFVCLALVIDKFIFQKLLYLKDIFGIALLVMFILPPPFSMSLLVRKDDKKSQIYVDNTISLGIIISLLSFIVIVFVY